MKVKIEKSVTLLWSGTERVLKAIEAICNPLSSFSSIRITRSCRPPLSVAKFCMMHAIKFLC